MSDCALFGMDTSKGEKRFQATPTTQDLGTSEGGHLLFVWDLPPSWVPTLKRLRTDIDNCVSYTT